MKPFDPIALRVGTAFKRGLATYAEAGRLLIERKASLKHGEWLPWLKSNADALGFSDASTAWRLMKLARENPNLASTQDLTDVREIARQLWGNDDSEPHHGCEWYTPPKYVALVARVFGGEIDLDVASCAEANERWIRARRFYSREQNALLPRHKWKGRVFCNPPYQTEFIGPFVEKIIAERANGNCTEAILLSSAWTDRSWFGRIFEHAALICFPRTSVGYIPPGRDAPTGNPKLSSAFSYFGANENKFAAVFREIGTCVRVL